MARQKSERAHSQVIEAAVALFAERGIEASSMDAIARASGVSKATIYRHWPDKDALVLEVLVYLHGLDKPLPVFDSGDFRTDLTAQLEYDPAEARKEMRERILPHLMAYASHNLVFGAAWRTRVLTPVRVALSDMMERGKQRGQLKPELNAEVGLALLLGPLIYRNVVIAKQGGKKIPGMEKIVAESFLAAFAVGDRKSRAANTKT
jgi:AcrR family transcriptional regulator